MAGTSVEFRVIVNADGLVTGMKQVTNFGNETQKTGKKAKAAGDEVSRLNYTMNQGVTGASSAARSFSKLSQSIGQGNGGLVGAYATLAANAFAVSASFNALREAAQVEQLMQGLEFQGAKTGRTLSTVATSIQEITQGSLSAADAMRAAALGSSAGLSAGDLEKLTQVATNASKVLGRNLPDSMDRIIKGVTKLEPELLDELGLMTKLTEASEIYARQVGKSAAALTNFEKRRAFVEAIQREGELKFAGVETEVDVNQFDRLAAAFNNLTQSVLGFISTSQSLRLLLDNLTGTTTGLAGATLLFASTIKNQLLGSFAQISETAKAAAEASKKTANDLSKEAEVALSSSKAMKEAAKNNMEAASDLNKGLRGSAKKLVPEFATLEVTDKESLAKSKALSEEIQANRLASTKRYEAEIRKLQKVESEASLKSIAAKREQIAANELLIESTKKLQEAREAEMASASANRIQSLTADKAQSRAAKEASVAAALSAASSGDVAGSYKNIGEAVKSYNSQLTLNKQAAIATAAASNTTLSGLARLQVGFIGVRTAAFAASTALKAVGVGLLAVLPWLGLLLGLVSVLEMVYDKLFVTDAERAKKKAFEELTQVTESTDAKIKEYSRTLQSNSALGEKTLSANIIKANSLVELADAYLKVADASKKSSEEQIKGVTESTSETERVLFPKLGSSFGGLLGNTKEEEQLIKNAEQLAALAPEVSKQFLEQAKAAKSSEEVFRLYEKTMRSVEARYKPLAASLENLKAQFKTTDEAQANLTKSLRPTTQFDQTLQGYRDLNLSLQQVQKEMLKADGVSSQVFADFDKIVTNIGSNITGVLTPAVQSQLATYNQLSLAIAEVNRKQQEGKLTSSEAAKETARISSIQKSMSAELSSSIQKELKLYENRLAKNQEDQIINQSRISLAQSELNVIQRKGILSVEALEKQQRLQDSIVALQVSELKLKAEMIQLQIRSGQARLEELEAQKQLSEQIKSDSIEGQKGYLKRVQMSSTFTEAQKQAATSLLSLINSGQEVDLSLIEQGISSIKDQNRLNMVAAKAANNAVKAAANQALSTNEKLSERQRKRAELTRIEQVAIREVNEASAARNQTAARLVDLQGDSINSLKIEVDTIRENAALRKAAFEQDIDNSIALLEADRSRQAGDERAVSLITLQIEKKKELKILEGERLDFQVRIDVLEKIGVKTQADALQILQESTSLYQKRLDLATELVNQESQLFKNRAELSILRAGGQVDEKTRLAIEADAAEVAKNAAIEQYNLRVDLIRMEYALLKAQTIFQVEELKKKESILRQENKPELANAVASARQNLEAIDFAAIEGMQRKQAKNARDIAIQNAEIAAQKFNNSIRPENFALAAARNIGARATVRRGRNRNVESGSLPATAPGESPELNSTQSKFGELKTSFMDVLDAISTGTEIAMKQFETLSSQMAERLGQDFGPQGKVLQALSQFMNILPQNFKVVSDSIAQISQVTAGNTKTTIQGMSEATTAANDNIQVATEKTTAAQEKTKTGFQTQMEAASQAFSAIAGVMGAIGSIAKASSDARIAGIDKEIQAEQKRDGKSAQSVEKIQALEKKKDDIARKSFNTQKKIMIAQAVMGTAAGVAASLATGGVAGIIMAGIVGAMGAAQIAIIAGTQYQSTSARTGSAPPSTLSIGRRSDSVDLARGPSANAGGEAGFLRGSQGMGSNASNFRTIGSAYGGDLMRGYGNRGFVVGEKGPEIITPDTPINVTPTNDAMAATPVNATFNIQALDASGVQDILVSQKGNIIKMIRDAANASGQGFLEDVNVNVYTRPSVNKL